jgi:hypothetical protein
MMAEQQAAPSEVRPMSFTEKIANIFAAPGELFENVRITGKTPGNWLIPMILFIIVGIIASQLMFSNAAVVDQLSTMIKQSMDKQVAEGKMTEAQAETAFGYAKPGSVWSTIASVGGMVFWTFIKLFGLALVFWLVGKSAMKATAPYGKVTEVVGLTMYIDVLEAIVTTLLVLGLSSLHAAPGLSLAIGDFDITNKMHLLMAKVNIFTFWNIGVTSIGLSKLFQRALPKVLVLVIALWLIWVVGSVMLGLGGGR